MFYDGLCPGSDWSREEGGGFVPEKGTVKDTECDKEVHRRT